jgi:branched-chain amino acid transport system substrate-binding protein
MRANRDSIFIVTLILALLVSTGAALTAWASAGARQTVQIGDTSGLTTTTSTNGTPSSVTSSGSSGGVSVTGGSTGSSNSSNSTGASGSSGSSGGTISGTGVIKIGGIFSESNGIDSTVEEDTVRACFSYYNAQGGIHGHTLQLVKYDDGLSSSTAAGEAQRLDTVDHVFAVVGWLAPFGESTAAPYFEQHGIPIVGGLGVPEEFGNQYSFPVSPAFYNDGYLLGQQAVANLHFKHPGIILTNTAGIKTVAQGIKDGAAAHGVTISDSDISYVSFGQGSFATILTNYYAGGVDGLITQIDPFSYVRLYQDMQTTHVFSHVGGAGLDKQSVDQSIGQPLQGSYSFMPYLEAQGNPSGNAEVSLYNSTVAKYYPSQVSNMDAFSEGSWVACRVFAQALANIQGPITRAALVQALNSGSYSTGGMAPTLNYGGTSGSDKNDASHCANFIIYNSSNRWQNAGSACH